jgi:hypothetical protein
MLSFLLWSFWQPEARMPSPVVSVRGLHSFASRKYEYHRRSRQNHLEFIHPSKGKERDEAVSDSRQAIMADSEHERRCQRRHETHGNCYVTIYPLLCVGTRRTRLEKTADRTGNVRCTCVTLYSVSLVNVVLVLDGKIPELKPVGSSKSCAKESSVGRRKTRGRSGCMLPAADVQKATVSIVWKPIRKMQEVQRSDHNPLQTYCWSESAWCFKTLKMHVYESLIRTRRVGTSRCKLEQICFSIESLTDESDIAAFDLLSRALDRLDQAIHNLTEMTTLLFIKKILFYFIFYLSTSFRVLTLHSIEW